MSNDVVVDEQEHVAIVRIGGKGGSQALTSQVLGDLVDRLENVEAKGRARVVVLTGGTRTFASGADVRELRDTPGWKYLSGERRRLWERLHRYPVPTVAAVAGYALGGGCELALACDVVVAGDTAVFGQPEVALGLLPGAGGTQTWARAAGRHVGAGVVLTGRQLNVWEARRLGLVHSVVPAEGVVDAAVDLATEMATRAPLALRAAKDAVRNSDRRLLDPALEIERHLLAMLLETDDVREGIDAFLEKRPPEFRGR